MEPCESESPVNLKENKAPLSNQAIIKSIDYNFSPQNAPSSNSKINSFVTPLRNNRLKRPYTPQTPQTPFLQTPTHDPCVVTPNGSKLTHPFLSNIIRNLDKDTMSPGFFIIKEKSIRDSSVLSPDISGSLFPVEIDTNCDVQYRFEAALFKKYEKYCNKKTDAFFKKGTIAPSPEHQDSGLGSSIQSGNPSVIENQKRVSEPINLLIHNTPPSKFKWNRDEFRNNVSSSQFMDLSYNESNCDEESFELSNHQKNLESTKIFDDSMRLASNISMRNHSIIESPTFFDEDDDVEEERDGGYSEIFGSTKYMDSSFDRFRSSPNSRLNSKTMDELDLSPIKGDISMASVEFDRSSFFD